MISSIDVIIGHQSSVFIPSSSDTIQMAFFPTLFQELPFWHVFFPIDVIMLNPQTLPKLGSLC